MNIYISVGDNLKCVYITSQNRTGHCHRAMYTQDRESAGGEYWNECKIVVEYKLRWTDERGSEEMKLIWKGSNLNIFLCKRWKLERIPSVKEFEHLAKDAIAVVLTLGTLSLEQMPSLRRRSLISQAKMEGHSRLNWATLPTTSLVATRGLLPPMALGRMLPVS